MSFLNRELFRWAPVQQANKPKVLVADPSTLGSLQINDFFRNDDF